MITVFVCIMAWKWEAALQESICCQFKRECFKKTVKMSSFHFPADYFEYIYIYMPVKLLLYIFTLKLIKISSMCASLLPRSYFFFFLIQEFLPNYWVSFSLLVRFANKLANDVLMMEGFGWTHTKLGNTELELYTCFCQTGLPENWPSHSQLQDSKDLFHKALPQHVLQWSECLWDDHIACCTTLEGKLKLLFSIVWSFM